MPVHGRKRYSAARLHLRGTVPSACGVPAIVSVATLPYSELHAGRSEMAYLIHHTVISIQNCSDHEPTGNPAPSCPPRRAVPGAHGRDEWLAACWTRMRLATQLQVAGIDACSEIVQIKMLHGRSMGQLPARLALHSYARQWYDLSSDLSSPFTYSSAR